jgi:hypothetical protein
MPYAASAGLPVMRINTAEKFEYAFDIYWNDGTALHQVVNIVSGL